MNIYAESFANRIGNPLSFNSDSLSSSRFGPSPSFVWIIYLNRFFSNGTFTPCCFSSCEKWINKSKNTIKQMRIWWGELKDLPRCRLFVIHLPANRECIRHSGIDHSDTIHSRMSGIWPPRFPASRDKHSDQHQMCRQPGEWQ